MDEETKKELKKLLEKHIGNRGYIKLPIENFFKLVDELEEMVK